MTQGALEDNFVYQEFKNLIKKFNIKKIIETGTYYGWSTMKLAEFGIDVTTIEYSEKNYNIAVSNFNKTNFTNIQAIFGSSPDILDKILTNDDNDTILFLDAHWYEYWPIHDELRVCIKKKIKPVIIIHDFLYQMKMVTLNLGLINMVNKVWILIILNLFWMKYMV